MRKMGQFPKNGPHFTIGQRRACFRMLIRYNRPLRTDEARESLHDISTHHQPSNVMHRMFQPAEGWAGAMAPPLFCLRI